MERGLGGEVNKEVIRVPIVIAPFAYETTQRNSSLDVNREEFGNGRRKCSAFAYTQDYLNAHDESLWGIVTNGKNLRILRNNNSLTTSAYIEIDFEQIFEYNKYDEFRIAWLLLHASMFGSEGTPVAECALENMRKAGIENGSRIADRLRIGVKQALLALGNGFLRTNPALRQQIQNRELYAQTYYNELLRIVYRLIFLITVEERELLHPKDATKTARERYLEGYSFSRIRNRTIRRTAHDRYTDLWEAMQITFEGLANGQKELGLPALGGLFDLTQCPHIHGLKLRNDDFLEAAHNLLWLADETHLVRINWRDMGPEEFGSVYEGLLEITPALSPAGDHFSFIEFTEQSGGKGKGSERKSTGSYYTPDSLVQVILNHTLLPLIDRTIAQNQKDPVKALLSLTIVDPACGSGHFLLSAARRLANKVAELRCPLDTPTPEDRQRAHRDVIKNCIYGVDINPMAVELCRVSLWLETIKPGEPLSFLDSHIQCGNSLLGATSELIQNGIPDDAWLVAEGDESKSAASLKKRNKNERELYQTQFKMFKEHALESSQIVAVTAQEIDDAAENTLEEVQTKKTRYQKLLESPAYRRECAIADAWCAAFLWNKTKDYSAIAPTHALFERIKDASDPLDPNTPLGKEVASIHQKYKLFHWHIQFPQVFKNGGFDCVLGNPPWERIKLQEAEFFATRSLEIANAPNAAARKSLIAKLKDHHPDLYKEYTDALARAAHESHFILHSGRYPLCGKGDVNTYSIFAEHNRNIMRHTAGFIVPSGLASDATTQMFFADLVLKQQLRCFYSFENREKVLFPDIDSRMNFALVILMMAGEVSPHAAMATPYAAPPSEPLPPNPFPVGAGAWDALTGTQVEPNPLPRRGRGDNTPITDRAMGVSGPYCPDAIRHQTCDFAFYLHNVSDLLEPHRHFSLTNEEFSCLNPNTMTCPTFRNQYDATLNLKIYKRAGILWDETKSGNAKGTISPGNPWGIQFMAMFHMSNDSDKFITQAEALNYPAQGSYRLPPDGRTLVPLYEAKFIHQYDHRFTTWPNLNNNVPDSVTDEQHQDPDFTIIPRYYIDKNFADERLASIGWKHKWLMGWRDICRSTDERTVISSIIPRVGMGNTFFLLFPSTSNQSLINATHCACIIANLNSFCLDYTARQKVAGTHLGYGYFTQLPIFTPSTYEAAPWFTHGEPLKSWIARRVVQLVCTSHDMEDFAREVAEEIPSASIPTHATVWNPESRFKLRCELDAAFFHLYGMSREETEYILDTFPIVRDNDIKAYGTYRTKDTILAIYDAMRYGM
ncbi:MAG: N-6 DNA methylase [Proteobacteria bacterium]|nr:N-6 DNA methylase [Pseudomonadota bacterium]